MSGQLFLWLLPPTSIHDRFAALIDALSRRLRTPAFQPHVTLLGSLEFPQAEVVSRAAALATQLAAVPVHLTDIGWSNEYFRCLYIRAERTPALLAAHRIASRHFERSANAQFMPHLSLVYGNLFAAEKQRLADELGVRIDAAFDIDRIGICLANGSPTRWRVIRTFALAGRPREQNRP